MGVDAGSNHRSTFTSGRRYVLSRCSLHFVRRDALADCEQPACTALGTVGAGDGACRAGSTATWRRLRGDGGPAGMLGTRSTGRSTAGIFDLAFVIVSVGRAASPFQARCRSCYTRSQNVKDHQAPPRSDRNIAEQRKSGSSDEQRKYRRATEMPYLIGTDEAGYAPNLGPLVVTATVWHVD